MRTDKTGAGLGGQWRVWDGLANSERGDHHAVRIDALRHRHATPFALQSEP
jgi:hypothetical protein